MRPFIFSHPLLMALLAAAIALSGAFGAAYGIQKKAAALSREQPSETRTIPRPKIPEAELAQKGRRLYLESCAHCHGIDVRGDEGPDLHDLQVSDRRISTVIKKGIKGEMPSFAKKHGNDDIIALIGYLRTLN